MLKSTTAMGVFEASHHVSHSSIELAIAMSKKIHNQRLPQPGILRALFILFAFHLSAAVIDINFFTSRTDPIAINGPCSIAMFQCDAAFLCCLFLNYKNAPYRIWIALPILLSALTHGFILYGWSDSGGLLFGLLPARVMTATGLQLLLSFLMLPSLAAIYWLLRQRVREPLHWLFSAGLSLQLLIAIYFASTVFTYIPTRVHSYWIDLGWLRYLVTVIAAIQSVTTIAVAVWTFDRFHRPGAWRLLPTLIAIGAAMATAPYLAIFVNIWIVTSRFSVSRIPISQFLTEAWTAATLAAADFIVPALTGLLMLALATSFWLSGALSSPIAGSMRTLDVPLLLHLPVLADENRRFRLWRLAGVALLLSSLSLVLGFCDWTMHMKPGRFADQGILFEVLLMAPLGLWSVQMAASALFLECRIWNYWKRLLIVVAWAEITLLAFWGQVGLSNALRWLPSDYVGAVLYIILGALLLSLVGRLVTKQTGAAPHWHYFHSEDPPVSTRGRFSLSLSDIICLVAISAGLIYPLSVIFALERWVSAKSLLEGFLIKCYWPLTSGAASYFALRALLCSGRQASLPIACSLLCLLASTASDQLILAFILDDLFFGIRWSVGLMALPAIFLGLAFLSAALYYLGFRVADSRQLKPLPNERISGPSDYAPISPDIQPALATPTTPTSPWD